MGKRGPQASGRVKWGMGPRIRTETREFLGKWCDEHGTTIAALTARLLEDEHVRLLLAELDEEGDITR